MSYRNKTTGEIISDQEYQTKFGGLGSQTPQAPESSRMFQSSVQEQPQKSSFLQRLKLGFGGREAIQQQHDIESSAGLRGKPDIGDIADVAGASLPIIGGTIGQRFGKTPGMAVGAALGQGARRLFGGIIGADQPTGGEIAKDVAITAGTAYLGGKVLSGLFNVITKTVPNKLISTIFKQSANDIATEARTGGTNLTQSQQVLNEGFRGDAKTMMKQSLDTMKNLEQQLQVVVSGQKVTISNKEGYINLLSDYLANLESTSYGFESVIQKEGQLILNLLKKAGGDEIPGKISLQLRRFIDGVRRTSSFKLNPNLSPKESAYKKAADSMRNVLSSQIEKVGPLMERYKINIDAFEDLAKYAAQSQNKDLFDLLDVFIMYGIDPTAYLVRKGLTSATLKTNVAQGLSGLGRITENVLPKGLVPTAVTQGVTRLFGR